MSWVRFGATAAFGASVLPARSRVGPELPLISDRAKPGISPCPAIGRAGEISRFIPTHVGNTRDLSESGEPAYGSSPRTWGTLWVRMVKHERLRFIPTHAGNTRTVSVLDANALQDRTRYQLLWGRLP